MNREIKFRVWDNVNKEYITWWLSLADGDNELNDLFKKPHPNGSYFDYEIEQYTGVKDKNGKEIYEGDIVKYCRFIENGVEKWDTGNGVVFERGCFWTGNRVASGMFNADDYKPGDPALMYWQDSKWFEVIGNIHENQDLLK